MPLPESVAITASRFVYELASPRIIEFADMEYVLSHAMRPHHAGEIVVTRSTWKVDDTPVESPAGKLASRLSVDLELLLVNENSSPKK